MALTFDCHGQQIPVTTLTPGSYGAAPSPRGRGRHVCRWDIAALTAFSPREKAAGMPMPEGRMRVTLILPQHLIREKLAPLAPDGGQPQRAPTIRAPPRSAYAWGCTRASAQRTIIHVDKWRKVCYPEPILIVRWFDLKRWSQAPSLPAFLFWSLLSSSSLRSSCRLGGACDSPI
jgi:hypothetical protein